MSITLEAIASLFTPENLLLLVTTAAIISGCLGTLLSLFVWKTYINQNEQGRNLLKLVEGHHNKQKIINSKHIDQFANLAACNRNIARFNSEISAQLNDVVKTIKKTEDTLTNNLLAIDSRFNLIENPVVINKDKKKVSSSSVKKVMKRRGRPPGKKITSTSNTQNKEAKNGNA